MNKLALIYRHLLPYEVHFCRRISREIPELEPHLVFFKSGILQTGKINEFSDTELVANATLRGYVFGRLQRHFNPVREVVMARRIFRYLTQNNVTVIVMNEWSSLSSLILYRKCYKNDLKVFCRSDGNVRRDRLKRSLRKWIGIQRLGFIRQYCDGFMAMGDFGKQYFVRRGFDAQKCYLIPYEPDYQHFEQVDPREADRFRRTLNLPKNRFLFLFVGRLVRQKGLSVLLKAFEETSMEEPLWDLIIVGEGPLSGELRQMIPFQIQQRVHWLGFLDWYDLPMVYHLSDIFVLPSLFEPWGVVLNEAMAAGLPVIATNGGGAAHELVKNGFNGRLVKSDSVPELATAMLELSREVENVNFQGRAMTALRTWRQKTDPIPELRRALYDVGLMPE